MNSEAETQADTLEADFSTLGYYEHGFIHLNINTCEGLGSVTNPRHPAASTFLHEYVHFMQDITSTQGLFNFVLLIQQLKNANNLVIKNPSAVFSIPLKYNNTYNLITNIGLLKTYRGSSHSAKLISYLGYRELAAGITANDGSTLPVTKYHVDYYDKGAQTNMTCHFGSTHIKEYMAHAIQNQFAPGTDHDDIPYRLVELILRTECPALLREASLAIALCDASLMDLHPSRLFFKTIERIKTIPNWNPANANEVYLFALEGVRFSGYSQDNTAESEFANMAKSAFHEFSDSLSANIFANNVAWFQELLTQACILRLNHAGFFTRLVSSPGQFSKEFYEIIAVLGIPFMTNADSKGYFEAPDKLKSLTIQSFFPKVFQAIYNTYQGKVPCSMHSFCEAGVNKITNNDCLLQPWGRIALPELCAYAQLWKTWGLAFRTPVASKN